MRIGQLKTAFRRQSGTAPYRSAPVDSADGRRLTVIRRLLEAEGARHCLNPMDACSPGKSFLRQSPAHHNLPRILAKKRS